MKNNVKKAISCLFLALLLLPWPSVGVVRAEGAGGEVTAQCAYSLPTQMPLERLTDDSLLTRMTIPSGKTVTITLPECHDPALYITWFALPPTVTLVQMDERDRQIQRTDLVPASPCERYALEGGCRKVSLSANTAWTVSTLRVFDGPLPEALMYFGEPMAQADLLVVMGQPQALFEELGGLAPLYTGKYEVKTAFCFLCEDSAVLNATAGDPRPLSEALRALWSLGYREAPWLGGFQDHDMNDLKDVQNNWTDEALEAYLVRLIRTLRPKVVVCAAGGQEDQRSVYAASQIENAVRVAANEGKYVEIGKSHKVQKLYISDPEGGTVVAYDAVSDVTAAAYRQVASRQFYKRALPQEGRFTLAYTTVGQDKGKKDLLENLKKDDAPQAVQFVRS